jgi:hypothetical protein
MTQIDTTPLIYLDDEKTVSHPVRLVAGTVGAFFVFLVVAVVMLLNGLGPLLQYLIMAVIAGLLIAGLYKVAKTKVHDPIGEFAALNGLERIPEEEMANLTPPSVFESEIGNHYTNRFKFDINGKSVYIYDYFNEKSNQGVGNSPLPFAVYTIAVVQTSDDYPHIYLDGSANGKNDIYKSWQRMSLEGDFDKYFKLYAEDGKGIEALTFLAPDVMARLIDTAQKYDIETFGNKVALISTGSGYGKKSMDDLLSCLEALLPKIDVISSPIVTSGFIEEKMQRRRKILPGKAFTFVLTVFFIIWCLGQLARSGQ